MDGRMTGDESAKAAYVIYISSVSTHRFVFGAMRAWIAST